MSKCQFCGKEASYVSRYVNTEEKIYVCKEHIEKIQFTCLHCGQVKFIDQFSPKNGICFQCAILIERYTEKEKYKAVLSTTVLPLDGTYRVFSLPKGKIPNLTGILHYVGHPDTKEIVENLGAIPAPTKLFSGLEIGESAICFPITQGKSNRAINGFTIHQEVSLDDLTVRIITRLKDI